jgi:rsbT co-antagonist protein RsbR
MTDYDNERVLERMADILMLLSEVTAGDYTSRLREDLEEEDPFRLLYQGINETVDSLAQAHERSSAYQRELEEKLATIERQRIAIRELSTPVIEVWDGLLCLPVVGVMDTVRSAEMTDTLLTAVSEKKARCTIIDITGIEVMDTGSADHFIRMAKAVRYLGAQVVLTGIRPTIAQTIVHLGVSMEGIVTRRSLRDALHEYVASHGSSARVARNGVTAVDTVVRRERAPRFGPRNGVPE